MVFEIGKMLGPVEEMAAGDLDRWRKETGEGNYRLIDVRRPAEYERGHIPGAVLVPLPELPARSGGLDPAVPVVVYCASGGRSRAAARFLAGRGFARVINLEGGIKAYRGATLSGPPDAGLALLKAVAGRADALGMALAMEQGLRDAYLALEDGVADGAARDLLERLAAMEEGHMRQLTAKMREQGGGPRKGRGSAGTVEGGAAAAAVVEAMRPLAGDPAALLEAAMGIEMAAMDLYLRMAAQADAGLADLFHRLAGDERRHMEILAGWP